MRSHYPWLSQGDFVRDVPLPSVTVEMLLEQPVGVRFEDPVHRLRGPAVLITDSCIIDKRTSSAHRPQATRFQFCSVHDLDSVDLNADQLR